MCTMASERHSKCRFPWTGQLNAILATPPVQATVSNHIKMLDWKVLNVLPVFASTSMMREAIAAGKRQMHGLYLDIKGKEGASGAHSLGQPLAVVAIATGGIHNCVPFAHKACPDCLQTSEGVYLKRRVTAKWDSTGALHAVLAV